MKKIKINITIKGVFILMNIIKIYLMKKNGVLNINQDRVYLLFFYIFLFNIYICYKNFFFSLKSYDS